MDCQPAVANSNTNNIRCFAGIIVIEYDWEFILCGSGEKPIEDAPLDRVCSLLDALRFFRQIDARPVPFDNPIAVERFSRGPKRRHEKLRSLKVTTIIEAYRRRLLTEPIP